MYKTHKQEKYKNIWKFAISFMIWGLLTAMWAVVWWLEYRVEIYAFGFRGSALYIVLYGALLFLFTNFYGGYRIGYYRREDVMFSNILGMLMTNVLNYLITCLVARTLVDYKPILVMTMIQGIIAAIWAYAASSLYSRIFPPHRMLLIYGGSDLAKSLIHKMISRSEKYAIQEVVNIETGYDIVVDKISRYEAVILCDLPAKLRNRLLKYCFQHSVRTYTTPKISDILIRGAVNISLFDSPLLLNRNQGLTMEQKVVKRGFDFLFSAIGLVVTLPLMLLTALAVKLYDGGPVFFKQKRCTLDNRIFTLVKFRSMIVDAEIDGKSCPAVDKDPRITPIGRIIRATRLDELPQLWNIFRGDMSIVGPRPERIEHVEKYTAQIPEFTFRAKVKAGLTGYSQVVGRYNTSAYDKLKMDLMYIATYSLVEDFRLILMTLKIMFVKSSTEGFNTQDLMNVPVERSQDRENQKNGG